MKFRVLIFLIVVLILLPVLSLAAVSSELSQKKTETENGYNLTYVDAEGTVTLASDKGYAILERVVENGKTTEEHYFDEKGNPVSVSGYYGFLNRYDDGHVIQITYVDANGKSVKNSSGYAVIEKKYDDAGHVIQEMYFDANGKPAALWGKQYGIRYEAWDKNNHCTQFTYLDSDEKPKKITYGYATVKRVYNAQGQVVYSFFYDEKGKPAKLSLGQYGEYHEYDEDKHDVLITYLNQNGDPFVTNSGYVSISRKYENGKVAIEWYLDISKEKVDIGRGQYGARYVYDGSKIIEKIALNQDGEEIFLLDQFLEYHPLFVLLGGIAAILAAIMLPKKPMLFLYLLFILYMTLYGREPKGDSSARLELFWSVREALSEGFTWESWSQIINNILLFIPFGFILYYVWPCPQAILVSLFLSAVIELSQYFFGLGLAEYDDVIWNTMGGSIGLGLGLISAKVKNRLRKVR